MKGNIKKLAVFVMVAAITMFIVVGMASADPKGHHALRGEYAATQMISSIFSIAGFDANLLTPIPCSTPPFPICLPISVSLGQRLGVFKFENDGTGSATLESSAINVSPPSGVTQTIAFDFTYSVDEDGMITITGVPGTWSITYTSGPNQGATIYSEGLVFTGPISPDGKIISLVSGSHFSTLILPFPTAPNNNFVQSWTTLIWQHNEKE
ncbi:MAG TPA: hypothetical protein VLZ10_14545 [Thermodesulfobacteriota bacterium]|nr:hypothetical protein [Thermodesulfobacteriota bacterium]